MTSEMSLNKTGKKFLEDGFSYASTFGVNRPASTVASDTALWS